MIGYGQGQSLYLKLKRIHGLSTYSFIYFPLFLQPFPTISKREKLPHPRHIRVRFQLTYGDFSRKDVNVSFADAQILLLELLLF